eukprot:3771370-Prymnesium_polylepis.1
MTLIGNYLLTHVPRSLAEQVIHSRCCPVCPVEQLLGGRGSTCAHARTHGDSGGSATDLWRTLHLGAGPRARQCLGKRVAVGTG